MNGVQEKLWDMIYDVVYIIMNIEWYLKQGIYKNQRLLLFVIHVTAFKMALARADCSSGRMTALARAVER